MNTCRVKPMLLLTMVLAVFSQAASAQVPDWESLRTLFAYDQELSLDVAEKGVEDRGSARVHDITYTSPMGGPVPAYLVVPAAAGPVAAAVLFLHPGQGNRSTFVPEAVTLAQFGVASLSIDAPFIRPAPWRKRFVDTDDPVHSRDSMIQTVVDLRRGIDLLIARTGVDADQIAYVGHSLGATIGGILAGVEQRPRTYILMAGQPVHSRWWRTSEHPAAKQLRQSASRADLDHYIDVVASVDAIHYIGHAAPATVFFQFAKDDVFISHEAAFQYFDAASEPKRIEWYDSDHALNEAARQNRIAWLKRQLGLH